MSRYTVIDLFSGCGGSSLGFADEGFELRAAVDIDPWASETYAKNLGLKPVIGDLYRISGHAILKEADLDIGETDVLIGCPPCQGFTRMRKRFSKGGDPRNDLVLVFAERVAEIRPKVVLFENVPGILQTEEGQYFKMLLRVLEENGYPRSLMTWGILNAADYGVPQRRLRFILIAVRGDLGVKAELPPRTHAPYRVAKSLGLRSWVTVREAIGTLPPLSAGEKDPSIPNHEAPAHSEKILRLISMIPKDGGTIRDLPREFWLRCHLRHEGYRDVYGRLWWNDVANTITSGCTNASKGRFIHPEQDRALTPREAARLQGFPDTFIFYGPLTAVARQIGNAMPPPLARAIASVVNRLLDRSRSP